MRKLHGNSPINKKPDPSLDRALTWGWLLPYLIGADEVTWRRWEYWSQMATTGELPCDPIPRIEFLDAPHKHTQAMLENALDSIPTYGSWRGWSGPENIRYFLQWILFGFGHAGYTELPREPGGCEGASMRLYQTLNIGLWMLWPYDYLGEMYAECNYGRSQGFFPTPHAVVEMMVRMTIGDEDARLKSVMDPCVGTGRFPLHASNHSLRLFCMDVNDLMCLTTIVHGYLYAPWLVKPLPMIEERRITTAMSDAIAEMAPPHIKEQMVETVHDEEQQHHFAPIVKRKKVVASQGELF